MDEPRFCPSCGSERTTGARFCATCGAASPATQLPATTGLALPSPSTSDEATETFTPTLTQDHPLAPPPPAVAQRTSAPSGPQVSSVAEGTTPTAPRVLAISRPAAVGIGALTVLLIGALVWGGSNAQTLGSTQTQLAATTEQLSTRTSNLAATNAQVAQLTSDMAQLASDKTQLTSDVAQIKGQVAKQTQCIAALRANQIELTRISELQRANFNRTAEGTAWAKANTNALNDYFKAYSAAFDRKLSTANSWIDKGNAEIKKASAEIKKANAATDAIEKAEAALATALSESTTTCGF